MTLKLDNAEEMLKDYGETAVQQLKGILEDQIAAAERALKDLPDPKVLDTLPWAVRRSLKWAEPSNAGRENLEHTLEQFVFWYGVRKAKSQE